MYWRKMKSVRVCFLIFLLLETMCCQGCWKEEKETLLDLRSRLDDLFSWDVDTDCCEWERVYCNSSTGRVAELYLDGPWKSTEQYINYSDFSVFKDLKNLSLPFNNIVGCVGDAELPNLERLRMLEMFNNKLDTAASIISCLDGLPSLKYLYLGYNMLNTSSLKNAFESLSPKLRSNLEVLDISGNDLTNDILPFLEGFKSLKELYLANNRLESDLHFEGLCSTLRNLEFLDFSANNFRHTDIGSTLSGLSSLKFLNLEMNELSWKSIYRLSTFSSLKNLDLSFNQINNFVVQEGLQSTSTLEVLALDGNVIDGKKLKESLRTLSSIKMLSMRENIFKGAIVARDFHDLKNLESLILDYSSYLENDFFQSIGDLTSLKVLSLVECHINGTLPAADWFMLNKLEELDLSSNDFEGLLPSSFVNMTSLRTLKLSYNYFIGNFASNLASLTSLEYFGFEKNQFEVPISFTPFANHSNLKFIYGEDNKVVMDSQLHMQHWIPKFQLQVISLSSTTETNSIPFPNFLFYQYNLTSLDFTNCKLEGEFPNWLLENNTQLEEISVRDCSFNGNFKLPSHPLLNIRRIDVSDNNITGQILGSNISSIFPNLKFLNMSINDIQGSIPHEFSQMEFSELDLSDNNLSGEIPKNISRDKLIILNLSNNKLHGSVFPTLSTLKNLEELYLDRNSLSGSIDSFSTTSLVALDLSNNHFVGNLPSVMGNFSTLAMLSLSNNNLGGSISTRFVELNKLEYLDISGNNFFGFLPCFANSSVKFIHMSNNRFSGLSKSTFKSSSLMILDLSYNRITSQIQDMILDLKDSSLNILILKGNNFSGHIPQHVCQLKELFILDLSSNNLSGLLPSCLGKMSFEDENIEELGLDGGLPIYDYKSVSIKVFPNAKEKVNFTTKKTSYTYKGNILGYMSGIDLSNNKLNGNIPFEFGNLTKIRALNLSYNDLIGEIPTSFSNLEQIESLDLSFNKLSGQIPPQLNRLHFLAIFSVAHNLTGETPERKGQFITFDESSYEDNPFLCGLPLSKSCNPYIQPHAISPNSSHTDGCNCSFVDMFVFWISFGVSCTSTFLVTTTILYINPYWRRRWFYNIELVYANCYYFIKDNFAEVFRL
ncbi:LRR receptor-like serine/threonine-protein kinase GSO2 [Vigna radiata var. radiata]|uniref:LRR receptor-like serine/threonine-protein kinase GSO2 n=1 Tax=Vigna radiata var. radiata TaxID=3916 RepID=A0A1S3W004_VIGRR|nr:LRR receptor-like serine/threonine-protein kinase GSO2 [Vigna radiata var. radiata]